MRLLTGLILLHVVPAIARATCGSEGSCPVDKPDTHLSSRFVADVSQLYIDQDQPVVGTRDAEVGAIPSHHDEIRTINRVTQVRAAFRLSQGWTFGAVMPYVSRTHEHIHHHMGQDLRDRWDDRGIGDLELSASRVVVPRRGPRMRLGLGVKAPTGKQRAALTEGGDPIEASARLGTGSWDVLANAGAEWRVRAPGKGADATMPVRLTIAGRTNGRGIENFRHGAEAQVHLGAEFPISGSLAALAQTNYRVRAKDDVGDADGEEARNTGGAAIYLTPGLRVDAFPGLSLYGLVQVPVWERVNGIQVVANTNLVLGVSRSIF
jgi:hypothetical protein